MRLMTRGKRHSRCRRAFPIADLRMPIVTGTSVLGLRYKDGVMLATDTLASYGSLARFMDVRRLEKIGDDVVAGASGDMSDWQNLRQQLTRLMCVQQKFVLLTQ